MTSGKMVVDERLGQGEHRSNTHKIPHPLDTLMRETQSYHTTSRRSPAVRVRPRARLTPACDVPQQRKDRGKEKKKQKRRRKRTQLDALSGILAKIVSQRTVARPWCNPADCIRRKPLTIFLGLQRGKIVDCVRRLQQRGRCVIGG